MKIIKLTLLSLIYVFLISSCHRISDEHLVKLIPVKTGDEFQYIDRKGKIIINPQFSEASVFRSGIALVRTTGDEPSYGFINEEGKYIIQASYKGATIFSEDLAWVVAENSAPVAINKKNEIMIRMQDAYKVRIFSDGLAAFAIQSEDGLKWGFVDKSGKIVINPQFSECFDFCEGMCAVCNSEDEWGFIDKKGKLTINYQFDGADKFRNGNANVLLNDKWGVINDDGKYIINPQFDYISADGDLYLCYQSGKAGWCDSEGKYIINPQFDRASLFSGYKLAAVLMSGKYGFVDNDGKISINPQFDDASTFNGKLALVRSGDKYGFIDRSGDYIINPQFSSVSQDYYSYISRGETQFNEVKTDYFNISAITEYIKKEIVGNSVSGYTLNLDILEILSKANRSLEIFNSGSSNTALKSNIKISDDAQCTFGIVGSPRYINYNGWYSSYQYNLHYKPRCYFYEIWLTNNGYGKGKLVFQALENTFTGFHKDMQESSDETHVLKNGDLQILTTYNDYALKLTVTPDYTQSRNDSIRIADSIRMIVEAERRRGE